MTKQQFGRYVGILTIVAAATAATSATAAPPPMFVEVTFVPGSGAPGCEVTFEGCYDPKHAVVAHGGSVTWRNGDSAAHTATSGTPVNGPSGFFDSGLVMAGNSFTVQFDNLGVFPYFDMVHPWATGVVEVLAVPEPASWLLLVAGLSAVGAVRKRAAKN